MNKTQCATCWQIYVICINFKRNFPPYSYDFTSECGCNQTCTGLSDRVGYFFAQRTHCGKREKKNEETPKNNREEKNLPFLPCDGVMGSNATLNKCGHCYTGAQSSLNILANRNYDEHDKI